MIRHEFESSLYKTAKYLLGYENMTPGTHLRICKILEGPNKKKLIVVPRGTFKSSIGVVAYPIWSLLKSPNLRFLIDSEVYTNSKNFIREIKGHLTNPIITLLWGEQKSDTNWSEGEITVKTRTKNLKEASITAGGVGTVKVGQHYDVGIFDDLNSDKNSATPEGQEKVWTHYRMTQAILDPGSTQVVIGTRYCVGDVIGNLLQGMGYDPADPYRPQGLLKPLERKVYA